VHTFSRTRLVVFALLILAITLITLDYRSGGNSPLRGVGSDVFGPFETGAGYVTRPVASAFDAVTGDDSGKITALQQQNDELRAELAQAQTNAGDVPQLKSLDQLADRDGYHVLAASVVGAGGSYSDTVTLDAGTQDGVAVNDTVLNGAGLIGTVTAVGPQSSTVLMASDADSVVGVRLEGPGADGAIGAVSGTGSSMVAAGSLRLRLFDASATLSPGEELVTFGSVNDSPYVPGVPVGVVTTVTSGPGALTQTANVRPFVDFSSVGVVGIVVRAGKAG
jgi:rod shape-determining protein MreC